MMDYKPQLVAALQTVGTVHYELFTDSNTKVPCITYLESRNSDRETSEILNYSDLEFTIKVWSKKVSEISSMAGQIDEVLRPLGFKRTGSNELTHNDMIQKVMYYSAIGVERKEEEWQVQP